MPGFGASEHAITGSSKQDILPLDHPTTTHEPQHAHGSIELPDPVHRHEPAESPITKQLRLEAAELKTTNHELGVIGAKVLKRPESHGNEMVPVAFAPRPTFHKKAASNSLIRPIISFAPPTASNHFRASGPPCRRTRSTELSASPPNDLTAQNERAVSVPETTGEPSPPRAANEPVLISSDDNQENGQELLKPPTEMASGEEQDENQSPDNIVGAKPTGPDSCRKSFPARLNPDTLTRSSEPLDENPSLVDPRSSNDELNVKRPRDSPTDRPGSIIPRTPAPRRSPLNMIPPARVVKPQHRITYRNNRAGPVDIIPATGLPSEEDLIFVVLHRLRESKRNAQTAGDTIRKLEHRNFELHAMSLQLESEKNDATTAHVELTHKYDTLQGRLEQFKNKYTKLKEFARSNHAEFVNLRDAAAVNSTTLKDLSLVKEKLRTSVCEADQGLRTIRSGLQGQRSAFIAMRNETSLVFNQLTEVTKDADARAIKIKELQRDKGRLEAHIIHLEHARQCSDDKMRDSQAEVSSAVQKMTARLDNIESAATQALPPVDDVVKSTLEAFKDRDDSIARIAELSANVKALQQSVYRGASSISESVKALSDGNESRSPANILKELKICVEEIRASAQTNTCSATEQARLEERLNASEQLHLQLSESLSQAKSHAASFQKGMENAMGMTALQRNKLAQLETLKDTIQVKWNRAASDLVVTNRAVVDRDNGVAHRLEELEALVAFGDLYCLEEAKDQITSIPRVDVEQLLEDLTLGFLNEIDENNKRWKASLQVADDEYSLVCGDIRNLEQGYSSLKSSNAALESGTLTSQDTIRFLRSKTSDLELAKSALVSEKSALLSSNTSLVSRNESLQLANDSLSREKESLESTHRKLQAELHEIRLEYARLKAQLDPALQQAQEARVAADQLQKVQTLYEHSNSALEDFKEDREKLHSLQERLESLHRESLKKSNELESAKAKLANAAKYPSQVADLNQEINDIKSDRANLQTRLTEAFSKINRLHNLQSEISSKNTAIEKLEAEISTHGHTENQLRNVRKENDRLSGDLENVRNELVKTQLQIRTDVTLGEQIARKEAELAKLHQEFAGIEQSSLRLTGQSAEAETSLSYINSIQSKPHQSKAETRDNIQTTAAGSGSQPQELEDFPSQESSLSFLQTQPQHQLTGPAQCVSECDHNENKGRSKRQAADRSLPQQIRGQMKSIEDGLPSSSDSTNIVPDTQLEIGIGDDLDPKTREDSQRCRRISSSHPVADGIGDSVRSENDHNENESEKETPETLQEQFIFSPPELSQSFLMIQGQRDKACARPSSAMTEDLFKQHATNLESTVLYGTRNQPGSTDVPDLHHSMGSQGHPTSTMRSTIDPKDLHLQPSYSGTRSGASPKQLRSGTEHGHRWSTPAPPSMLEPAVRNTSSSETSRHQSNSAIKRTAGVTDLPIKRLKRESAGLEPLETNVQPPRTSNNFATTSSSSKASAGSSRKGGSVVGYPAPTPGKSQKATRSGRKHSVKDKYAKRFNPDF